MVKRKPILGLCGGIGSGKSRVAAEFAAQGGVVIDSDRLSHEILARPEVLAQVAAWWGPEVAGPDGRPNRSAIASLVFSDARKKRQLEDLLYPLIAARRSDIIQGAVENPAVKTIILDSPLLFESNLDRLCDFVVFVEADESTRLQRLAQSRGWNEEEMRRRERWQMPLEQKRSRSQFTIDNNGPETRLPAQVAKILADAISRMPSSR